MIEFGKTLRAAREAKGLSISQVAETTRIMHSIVEGLEAENFSGIPAPIYGRGFVKLYCEAVGLDPKPMVAEFMEIYNGNRDVAIKERPRTPAPAPEPVPETAPAPVVEEPSAAEPAYQTEEPQFEPLQTSEAEPADEPLPAPEDEPAPSPYAEPDLFTASRAPAYEPPAPEPPAPQVSAPETPAPEPSAPSLSRYATPVRQRSEYNVFPMLGRWAALALGAVLVLALVVLGLRALYRATSPAPSDIDDTTAKATEVVSAAERHEAAPQKAESSSAEPAPRKERTPQDIPSLYID